MSYGPEDFCEHGDLHKLCGVCAELTQLRALRDAVKAWVATVEAEELAWNERAQDTKAWIATSNAEYAARDKLRRVADGLAGEEGKQL